MPASLVNELKRIAVKNHFLDISEEIRSLLREKYLSYNDPYSSELEKIRKNITKITMPEKIDALKQDLKKLLEGLDELK
ncbi:hypothetical protein JXB41_03685 [Candidatus Woesearchaeota archaeon]|nr:hypothetical protein [Candidatus Woesearchaeota archaeon]